MKKSLTLICLFSIILTVMFVGCATDGNNVVVYPITEDDIQTLVRGTECQVPEYSRELEDGVIEKVEAHTYKVKKDGRYLSELYINEILEAKFK